jgi:hypothetical protein
MTPSRRRWLRWLLFVLILASVAYLARHPLLRWVAGFLVVEDPVQTVDAVVPLDGDHLYEATSLFYRNDLAKRILLIEGPPGRLERMGILPHEVTLARRELAKYDVPDDALEIVKMENGGDWNRARRLRDWLTEHPDAQVCILCDRFSSRRTRCLFTRELGGLSGHVHWRALPDRRYDERNWHHSRGGVLALFDSYLSLGHLWLYGDALGDRDEWDPDAYQNNLP